MMYAKGVTKRLVFAKDDSPIMFSTDSWKYSSFMLCLNLYEIRGKISARNVSGLINCPGHGISFAAP